VIKIILALYIDSMVFVNAYTKQTKILSHGQILLMKLTF